MAEPDKRRAHRLRIELPATFTIAEAKYPVLLGTTIDISAVGICLKTRAKLDVGQELAIHLRLPDEEKILIHTEVVWVKELESFMDREYSIGIKIIDALKTDESKFVKYYVSQLFKEYPPP